MLQLMRLKVKSNGKLTNDFQPTVSSNSPPLLRFPRLFALMEDNGTKTFLPEESLGSTPDLRDSLTEQEQVILENSSQLPSSFDGRRTQSFLTV
jgi:hypothetical protein